MSDQEQEDYYEYYSTSNEGYSSAYSNEYDDGVDLPTVLFDSDDESIKSRNSTTAPSTTTNHETIDEITIPVFRFSNTKKRIRKSRKSHANTNPGSNQSGKHIKAPPLITTVQPEMSSDATKDSSNQLSPAPKFIDLDTPSEIDYRDVMSPRRRRTRVKQIFNEEDPIIDDIDESDEEQAKNNIKNNLQKASREYIKAVEEQKKQDAIKKAQSMKLPVPQNTSSRRTNDEEINTYNSYYTTYQDNNYSDYSDYEESAYSQYSEYNRLPPLRSPHSTSVNSSTNIQPATPPPPLLKQEEKPAPINESQLENHQSDNNNGPGLYNPDESESQPMNIKQESSGMDPTRKALLGVTNNEAVAKLMEDTDEIDDSFFHDINSQEVDIRIISQAPAELTIPTKKSKPTYVDEAEVLEDLPTISQGISTTFTEDVKPVSQQKTVKPAQADDLEDISIDSTDDKSLPPNNYGKVSGSAVLDIANEAKGGKLVQAIKPLKDVENEVKNNQRMQAEKNRERILAGIRNSTQPEVVSIDSQGNTHDTYASQTYGSRRRRNYEPSLETVESTTQSTRKSSLIEEQPPKVEPQILPPNNPISVPQKAADPAPQPVQTAQQNKAPQNPEPVRVRRRPTRGTATTTMTDTQTGEYSTAIADSNVRRRVRPTRAVRDPPKQDSEEIARRQAEENARLKKLAEEADQQRKLLQIENRVRPGGNERMILALPTTSTATREHVTEDTSEMIGNNMMFAQIDVSKTLEETQKIAEKVEKVPLPSAAAKARQEEVIQKKQEDVEILEPESAAPETLATITVTRDPSQKADAFADAPYRPTIPNVKKSELLKDAETYPRPSGDPLSPIKGWPAFQVPLISNIDLTAERKKASIEFDFMKLLDEIRAV